MTKIVINPFDKNSIAEAEKLVREYKEGFEAKVVEFTRRLAEIGVTVAEVGYMNGTDYRESSEITVSLVKKSNGYSVVASGRPVGFLEFGTGRPDRNREWVDDNHISSEVPVYTPPERGSYGKHQGMNPWGWWFNPYPGATAEHTYGEYPAEAMLTARNYMVEQVTAIAREVWR